MATTVIPDRFQLRLAGEQVIWLTTVAQDGTPQPNPVWFLWEAGEGGNSVLTFSQPGAKRLAHIKRNPHVSLTLNSTPSGGDVTVVLGTAEVIGGDPSAFPDYVAKYRSDIERISGSVEAFANDYSVPMRIHVSGVRGF
jgi:PPOX class probable F420-dependent enzyme